MDSSVTFCHANTLSTITHTHSVSECKKTGVAPSGEKSGSYCDYAVAQYNPENSPGSQSMTPRKKAIPTSAKEPASKGLSERFCNPNDCTDALGNNVRRKLFGSRSEDGRGDKERLAQEVRVLNFSDSDALCSKYKDFEIIEMRESKKGDSLCSIGEGIPKQVSLKISDIIPGSNNP